jgi:O-antigen/teichoic acid export membrane protein
MTSIRDSSLPPSPFAVPWFCVTLIIGVLTGVAGAVNAALWLIVWSAVVVAMSLFCIFAIRRRKFPRVFKYRAVKETTDDPGSSDM